MYQKTISKPISLYGKGLHSGKDVCIRFLPSSTNQGIIFRRVDLDIPVDIPAKIEFSKASSLCTALSKSGIKIQTIEHLMAAIHALAIDNLIIEINSDEVPIMDGSSKEFYEALSNARIIELSEYKKLIRILKPIFYKEEDKFVQLTPANQSLFSCHIDFNHPIIQKQSFHFQLSSINFKNHLCNARTFGFKKDVSALKQAGYIQGGSLENAIVLDESNVINSEGLRFNDEFVRHKLLDAIGDLSLAGHQIIGLYTGFKSSHSMHHHLLQTLSQSPDSWKYELSSEAFKESLVA